MRKFERSIHIYLSSILLAIFLVFLRIIFQAGHTEGNSFVVVITLRNFIIPLVPLFFFLVAWAIAKYTIPPDFNYTIRLSNDEVIFEFSDEDYRKINKNFSITRRTGRYIVLYDGVSRMRIPYNEEVIQFLNEIKK